jgi:Protein of unknown function (DUF1003)
MRRSRAAARRLCASANAPREAPARPSISPQGPTPGPRKVCACQATCARALRHRPLRQRCGTLRPVLRHPEVHPRPDRARRYLDRPQRRGVQPVLGPYSFILLNRAFSTQAAYAAPLILLAQTRQADRDKAAADQLARIANAATRRGRRLPSTKPSRGQRMGTCFITPPRARGDRAAGSTARVGCRALARELAGRHQRGEAP